MSRFKLLLGYSTGLAVMAAGFPAFAQVLEAPPPTQYSLDARGVDVVRGSFNYSTTEVAIGPPGEGGLTYERTFMAGGWRDNLTGTIEELPGNRYAVSIGAMTEVFQREVSGAYTPERNTGSTLSLTGATMTYTTSDGTTALFSPPVSTNPTNPAGQHAGRIFNMIRPNGERMDFHYKDFRIGPVWDPDAPYVTRLQGVENNLGYVIKLKYALDNPTAPIDEGPFFQLIEVMGVNRAVDTCAPEGDSCPGLTRSWPKATYGVLGAWETVTDGVGLTTSYQANANGVLGIRYPGSAVNDVTVAYDGSGRASSVTNAGSAWTYGYSDAGPVRTTTITDPLSNVSVATSSLTTGLMTLWRDAAFQTTGYVYDVEGRLINTTLPEGNQVLLTLDARGNVTQTTAVPKSGSSLPNIVTSAAYPASCASPVTCNLPTSTTDARGFRTDYAWNATHGGLESATQPAPSGAAPIGSGTRPETRIAYATQTAWYKDNLGVVVAAPWSITLPVSSSTCAAGSAPTCVGSADAIKSTVVYGTSGVANNLLPTSTTSGDGTGALAATTATTWTPDGDLETVDGPLSGAGDLTRYRYDVARRPVGAVGPDPDGAGALQNRAVRINYDARGLVALTEQGVTSGYSDPNWAAFSTLQRTAATYDAYRRPVTQAAQDAAGTPHQLIQVGYDAAGRADCTAQRMNPAAFGSLPGSACTLGSAGAFGPDRITQQAYDAVGRPSVTTSGLGTISAIAESATYTANGMPQTLVDGNGNRSTAEYDGFDRLGRLYYPTASNGPVSNPSDYQEYTYDPNGNAVTYRTRNNQLFTTTYDALNRQAAVTSPANVGNYAYTYDLMGRVLTASVSAVASPVSPASTSTMTWDALGRQLTETKTWGASSLGTSTWPTTSPGGAPA